MSTPMPPLPEGLSEEAFFKFMERAREAIADALDAVAIQTLSGEEAKLLTPALVSSILMLCGMDFCAAKGVTVEQFVNNVLSVQAQALTKAIRPIMDPLEPDDSN